MDKIQVAITIIVVLAFVTTALAMMTVMRHIVWPDGERMTFRHKLAGRLVDIHIIVGEGVFKGVPWKLERDGGTFYGKRSIDAFTLVALEACAVAWEKFGKGPMADYTPAVVVHYVKNPWRGLHGYQTYAKARIGPARIPMYVIAGHLAPGAQADPLIDHEVAHSLSSSLLGHPGVRHETELWDGFEQEAALHYARLVGGVSVNA